MKIINNLITQLIKSQNIQKNILVFVVKNREWLEKLDFQELLELESKYSSGLESILFLIALTEISKVIKNKNIRVFLLYLTQKKDENLSIEKFIENDMPFFYDDTFLEKSFYQSLPLVYDFIHKRFRIVFETRYKLAEIFAYNINTQDMANELYSSLYPIYNYLVKTQINSIDAINYQTIEDNQRLIDAIEFFILFDVNRAFLYLEKLKGKIFIYNLSMRQESKIEEIRVLQNKIFYLQQKLYKKEDMIKHIEEVYKLKLELHNLQIKYDINEKSFLNFDEVKRLL